MKFKNDMKIKNFNFSVFVMGVILFGLLLIPCFFAAYGKDEGILISDGSFWNFFASLFYVLRFPTHTLLWPIITKGGPFTFFGGLFVNCMFYGLLIERFILILRSKNNSK